MNRTRPFCGPGTHYFISLSLPVLNRLYLRYIIALFFKQFLPVEIVIASIPILPSRQLTSQIYRVTQKSWTILGSTLRRLFPFGSFTYYPTLCTLMREERRMYILYPKRCLQFLVYGLSCLLILKLPVQSS